jgi:hypothetical protein
MRRKARSLLGESSFKILAILLVAISGEIRRKSIGAV